jgi:glutaminyl-tRNA synthetase
VLKGAKLEPSLANADRESRYQFERLGYFCRDTAAAGNPVFNRTATLRDSWTEQKR